MKLRFFIFLITILISGSISAQEIDPTTLLANTRTFILDDGKNTVTGYILQELKGKTTCCGEERIYLEVRIDPSGSVISAKALTGKKEGCLAKSAVDIVKNVKWDASEFRGPKPVYFEVRPKIECEDGRDNVYEPIETFNNEKLDAEGEKVVGDYKDVLSTVTEQPTTPAEDPEPAPEEVAATPAEEAPTTPTTQDPETTTADAVVTAEPGIEEVEEEPIVISNEPMPSETEVVSAQPNTETDTPPVQSEEIQKLREEMAKMREAEEARRKKIAAREAELARRELERQKALAARGIAEDGGGTDWGDGSEGADGGFSDEGYDDSYAIANEISELESQREELRQMKEQRLEEVRQRIEENRAANEEIIRLEEQIIAKNEEASRRQEEQELQTIEQEVAQIDEQRQREEEEYQRMMDEIKRLQDEAEAKIAELDQAKAELEQKQQLRKMREQEIALSRALREEQNKKQLEETRLTLLNSGANVTLLSDASTSGDDDFTSLLDNIDYSAPVDSEALREIVLRMRQMEREIELLQQQIIAGGGQPATDYPRGYQTVPQVPAVGQPTPAQAKTRSVGDRKSGADSNTLKVEDILAPGMSEADLIINQNIVRPATGTPAQPSPTGDPQKVEEVPSYRPGKGYSPHPSHKETHVNADGPEFGERTYVDGAAAMKDIIKQQMRDGGVCGLAQSLFSVTLDPQGKVLGYQVLGANTEEVASQLSLTIPTLQFNSIGEAINQTVYLQFKAEIVCEGIDRVPLKEVQDIIKE